MNMEKILYWFGANMTHYCIAKSIQDKIPVESYAIIDVTNKPKKFFKNQKIVNFKKTWFYHDHVDDINKKPDLEFLKEFEKKYEIQLSSLIFSERLFLEHNEFYKFKTEQILKILELECKFFEKILDDTKPNFVLMFTPYFHHEALLFKLCKAKKIKVLELNATRFSQQGIIDFSEKIKKYDNFSIQNNIRTFKELREYFDNKHIFKQNKTSIEESKGSFNDLMSSAFQYFIMSNNENIKTHYSYLGRSKMKVFLNYFSNSIKIKKRKQFLDDNFLKKINNDKFILFPLQTEAESALLLDAPLFTNQVEVIKQISKSIPIDYKLLVKEHPGSITRSWRSIETYQNIINIPQVIPIHPEVPIDEIIKKASLIITISSSVSLDSLFYETPSIILSDTTFSMIPSIYRLKEIDRMAETIQKMLETKVEPKDLEKYIQFSEQNSFEFNPLGFTQNISDYFHFAGKFVDVEISEEKMNKFLDNERESLDILANEYIKYMKTS